MTRYVSFDFGISNSCTLTSLRTQWLGFVRATPATSMIVLENIVWYPNWIVKRLNKRVKEYFGGLGIRCKYLLPSQKATVTGGNIRSGGHKDRKAAAVVAGREWLL